MTVTLKKREWRALLGSLAVTDELTIEVSALASKAVSICSEVDDMDAVAAEGDCHVFELMLTLTKYDTPGREVIRRSVMAYRAPDAWNNTAMKEAA